MWFCLSEAGGPHIDESNRERARNDGGGGLVVRDWTIRQPNARANLAEARFVLRTHSGGTESRT
jgi:hypothetical protein